MKLKKNNSEYVRSQPGNFVLKKDISYCRQSSKRSSIPIGNQIPEDSLKENIVDPAEALSLLKQAEASWQITNQVLTPSDYSRLVQSLSFFNSKSELFILTVSLVTQNVKSQIKIKETDSKFKKCDNCKYSLKPYKIKHNNQQAGVKKCDEGKCLISDNQLDLQTEASHFICDQCTAIAFSQAAASQIDEQKEQGAKEICAVCFTQHFVRKSIKQKTQNHWYFEDYVKSSDNSCKKIQKIIPFKEIHTLPAKKYALIGLWKANTCQNQYLQIKKQQTTSASYECVSQFRIDYPKAVSLDQKMELQDILYLNDEKTQIFFFNTDSKTSPSIFLNIIDVDELTFLNYPFTQIQKDIFELPVKRSEIKKEAQELLEKHFKVETEDATKLRLVQNKLCVSQDNILNFIDMNTWSIYKVNDAYLLLQVQTIESQIQSIWYINDEKIYEFQWSNENENELSAREPTQTFKIPTEIPNSEILAAEMHTKNT